MALFDIKRTSVCVSGRSFDDDADVDLKGQGPLGRPHGWQTVSQTDTQNDYIMSCNLRVRVCVCRSFDDDADFEMKGRDRWGDPMAGKLNKKKLGDGFDLPPPVITEANRAMMEASGRAEGGGKGGRWFWWPEGHSKGGGGVSPRLGSCHSTDSCFRQVSYILCCCWLHTPGAWPPVPAADLEPSFGLEGGLLGSTCSPCSLFLSPSSWHFPIPAVLLSRVQHSPGGAPAQLAAPQSSRPSQPLQHQTGAPLGWCGPQQRL